MGNQGADLSLSSRVVAAEGQASAKAESSILVLRLAGGRYFELKGAATHVWGLLDEPVRVEALRDALVERFDVAPERCERDLLELLSDLLERGLVEVVEPS